MIHQPLGGAQGQAADIEIQANEIMVGISLLQRSMDDSLACNAAPQVNAEWLPC